MWQGFRCGLCCLLLVFLTASSATHAQDDLQAVRGGESPHLLYVAIPSDVLREDVVNAGDALKDRLHRLVQARVAAQPPQPQDLIVVFVDRAGRPILPDLEAAREQSRTETGNLAFTFTSPTYPWTAEEQIALTSALNDFYPVARTIYGDPAFDITVNIRKDPTSPFPGLYYASLNEIVMRTADALDALCHEMIHAFRDDNVISLASFEEGMTRTAEVEVFNRLADYTHWDENHNYTYDVYYEGLNLPKIGSAGGGFFNGYVAPLLRYQLAGYAWAKVLIEDRRFLSDFNAQLYRIALTDSSATSTESTLLAIADRMESRTEGIPFRQWYGLQGILDTSPPAGYFIYQRLNQFTVDFFVRDTNGAETMQPNVLVEWAVYDFRDTLLSAGSAITTANGWADFVPVLPADYTGRIRVVVDTAGPDGVISDTSYRAAIKTETGLFGIVPDADFGVLTVTRLGHGSARVTVNVTKGAFSAPLLAGVKGRFHAVFRGTLGERRSRWFNKDAGDYFLVMAP